MGEICEVFCSPMARSALHTTALRSAPHRRTTVPMAPIDPLPPAVAGIGWALVCSLQKRDTFSHEEGTMVGCNSAMA